MKSEMLVFQDDDGLDGGTTVGGIQKSDKLILLTPNATTSLLPKAINNGK